MKNKKKLLVIIVALILLLVGLAILLGRVLGKQEAFLVTLNERDVTLEVGETMQLEMLPIDEEDKLPKYTMEWKSSNPKVATVDENGLVTAIAGGETRITVIIQTKEQEYSASCVITILGEEDEQAAYKIRWFVQKKDRDGYEVTEESYTRLIGSEVVIEKSYALSKTPSKNYVLNEEKSNLKGTVKKNRGLILEVYYDVAEVTYTVNAYYETADLGMYLKESKQLKAYAFTEVTAPDLAKTGYVFNKNKAGTVTKIKEVQAGSQLASYYNRVRANVTISYISGKPSVTYQCIYGVGLKDAPASAFEDSFAPYQVAPFANGKKISSMENYLKSITKDTTIEYKVDAEGFVYSAANGGTLTNNTTEEKTAAYTYFAGKDSTIYLEATYNLTGYTDNMFGVELKSGGTTREIRFSEYGISVMKDHKNESGIIGKDADAFNYASAQQGDYAWAQNMQGNANSIRNSVIKAMCSDMDASKHKIVWAVWKGTLYAQVDGQMCVRLPLSLLDESWTADAQYEIAFSTWDKYSYGDNLSITDITVCFGNNANNKLVLDKQVNAGLTRKVHYEPITGSYLPESYKGASYIYSENVVGDVAVSATVSALDIANTVSNMGISVMVNGDPTDSFQIFVENNSSAKRTTGHVYGTRQGIPSYALLDYEKPYQEGVCKLTGVVKDAKLYILFNEKQVYAIPLEAILTDYNPAEDKIAIGVAANDASLGLYQYENVSFMSGVAVSNVNVEHWGFTVESYTGKEYSKPIVSAKDSRVTVSTNAVAGSYAVVKFTGKAKTWEISGTVSSDAAVLLKHGILIECDPVKLAVAPKYGNTSQGAGIWLNGNATNNKWKAIFSVPLNNKDVCGIFNDGTTTNDNNKAGIVDSVYSLYADKNSGKVKFKYQIVNDVLYAWYCAANADMDAYATATNYAWKIDLTDSELGGFTAGSKYSLGLRVTNSAAGATGNSITEDLTVKVGSQVDTTIVQTIETKNWPFNLNYNLVDSQTVNEKTSNRATNTNIAAIYYPGRSNIVWTSADVTHSANGQGPIFGVTVGSLDGRNAQIYVRSNSGTGGLYIYQDHSTTTHAQTATYAKVGHYTSGVEVFGDCKVSGTTGSYAFTMNNPQDGRKWNIQAAIYDNCLYISLDDVLLYAIPMTAIYEEWTDGTLYSIGYANFKGNSRAYMNLSNMQAYFGTAAIGKLKLTNSDQQLANSNLMTYNPFDGTYIPSNASGYAYAYGRACEQKDALAMQTTIVERATTTGTIKAGVAVKLGDASKYILNDENGYGNIAILKANPLTLSVVMMDKKLYIWDDNSNTPIYEKDLRDIFGDDYDKDATVQIGFVTKDSDLVAEMFKDTKFYTGDIAKKVYEALKNGTEIQATPLDIYLIAGQSNAAGSTQIATSKLNVMKELEALNSKYIAGFSDILYSGTSATNSVMLVETKANVHNNGMMGPEVGMAETLSGYYNASSGYVAGFIKYAYGGTALLDTATDTNADTRGNWVSPSYEATMSKVNHGEMTGKLYENLLAQISESLGYYEAAGYAPVIKGLYWMQGEADRPYPEEYKRAFKYFAEDIRRDLTTMTGKDLTNMPIIIGEISETFSAATDTMIAINKTFIKAQNELAAEIEHCYIADNSKYAINEMVGGTSTPVEGCMDTAHWNWKDCLAIGRNVGDLIKKYILGVTE